MLNITIYRKRREYNAWVADETLEDYALRYTSKSFRKWPEWLIANTALGGISFLALEAIGGAITISYGFTNAFWAIVTVTIICFLTGLPITYYAAKYNIDIDLLTRGAGFGYIGSTITSLIYASFTFIFFALEAAIMAQALELYFNLPLPVGYIVCSVIIIPMVIFGVTFINKLQFWTQPIWFILMLMPYIFVLRKDPESLTRWLHFSGNSSGGTAFTPLSYGAAATVAFSLIVQIGEQVDYLRFLPDKGTTNRYRWWLAAISAGPGWIILGGAKLLGGSFLAALAVHKGIIYTEAIEPIQMYLIGFEYVFSDPAITLSVATFFVIISQIKINVTNAYAGSLAWSNFFSRLTHFHPGRVVWLVFNVLIAVILMQLGVFATLEKVLALYANVAIAWIGAIIADLIIIKPLGLSPSYLEFKRAHLHNINPVGFGAMVTASLVSMIAFVGKLGSGPQAFSSFIALGIAFILAPLLALITKGKYYIARKNVYFEGAVTHVPVQCCTCEHSYEPKDMAFCPAYDGPICSLCCTLDSRCHDICKASIKGSRPVFTLVQSLLGQHISQRIWLRSVKFTVLFLGVAGLVAGIFYLFYVQEATDLPIAREQYHLFLVKLYFGLLVPVGVGVWLFLLSQESRQLAEEELNKQNIELLKEISQREKVELDLRESEERFELAVKGSTDGIWDWADVNQDSMWWSARLYELIGYNNNEINASYSQFSKLLNDRDRERVLKAVDVHLRQKVPYDIEFQLRNKTGKYRWFRARGQAIWNHAGSPLRMAGSITDIDDRKHAQEELTKHRDQLKHLVRERTLELEETQKKLLRKERLATVGQLTATVSHELRNPLGAMRNAVNVIKQLTQDEKPILKNSVEIADRSVTRCDKVINDMLDFTRIRKLERKTTPLDGWVEDVLNEFALPSTVILHRELNSRAQVPIDRDHVQRALINILKNACDAMIGDGETDRGLKERLLTVSTRLAEERIELVITDTGPGIPQEDLAQIFEPLFSTKSYGVGLGLPTVKQIMEQHDGGIKVTSKLNRGTHVILWLPSVEQGACT